MPVRSTPSTLHLVLAALIASAATGLARAATPPQQPVGSHATATAADAPARPPWRVCREVLHSEIGAGLAAGAARRTALATPAAVVEWQRRTRSWLRGGFEPLPPPRRDPPPVEVVRSLARDGFRIEHLLIESRPGMRVPAHLYLPDPARFEGPVPGVLVACGHSADGKAYASYQRGAATLATYGLAALVYDPLDQGERVQSRPVAGRPPRWGTRAHNVSGAQALLVGWSQAGLEAWDGVRCLDALAARDEVDAERLGVCGNSGGGTQSAQLFALDDRLDVAAPSCYLTSFAALLPAVGPQDAEQNLVGQLARGFDHADYLAVRAPAPALLCAATRDFFPIAGTKAAFVDARRVYATAGAPDAIALAEVDAGHGWHPELIESTTAFLVRWLDGRTVEPHCVAAAPMADAQSARVTPTGNVLDLRGERSVFALLAGAAEMAGRTREELAPAQRVERARQLCGVAATEELPRATRIDGEGERFGLREVRMRMSDGMELAAAVRSPEGGSERPPTLVVGAGAFHLDPERAVADFPGRLVVWLDPHAIADSAPGEEPWYGTSGPSGRDAALGVLLGRPLLGRQAEQILAVARHVAGEGQVVDLVARGPAALAALHAAAFEPDWFGGVDVETPIASWTELMGETPEETLLPFVVPGALTAYDLEDLREAVDRNGRRGTRR